LVPEESVKFCPFGSKVWDSGIEGTQDFNLPGEPARTGREQRYPGLLMLKGCGTERMQGEASGTSGPIQACPVYNFNRQAP